MAVFKLYKDKNGEYRWRFRAANNKIVADSGEGYIREQGALDDIEFVKKYSPGANIDDLTGK